MRNLLEDGLVEEVKSQWKRMWRERIDDHVRAEGVARESYDSLFVEKGTVVTATRDFKVLALNEIMELHRVENVERLLPPDPCVGGWGKFIRANITNRSRRRSPRRLAYSEGKKQPQQAKKGGRGWLHV